MAGFRMDKINDAIRKELSDVLPSVKDYRVKAALVTVTEVDCTKDLKQAKIFFSCVSKKATPKEVAEGLKSAGGYLRSQLATRLNLRVTPELHFIYDDSMDYSANILRILHEVGADTEQGDDDTTTD